MYPAVTSPDPSAGNSPADIAELNSIAAGGKETVVVRIPDPPERSDLELAQLRLRGRMSPSTFCAFTHGDLTNANIMVEK